MTRPSNKSGRTPLAFLYGMFAFYALKLSANDFGLLDGLALIGFGFLAGLNLGLPGSRTRR